MLVTNASLKDLSENVDNQNVIGLIEELIAVIDLL